MTLLFATAAEALLFATASEAQQPNDPGETNLLTLACGQAVSLARSEGITVRNCRRAAPEVVVGYEALVKVRISTDRGPFTLEFDYQKSPWSAQVWTVTAG